MRAMMGDDLQAVLPKIDEVVTRYSKGKDKSKLQIIIRCAGWNYVVISWKQFSR